MHSLTMNRLCVISTLIVITLVELNLCAERIDVKELLERHVRRKRGVTSDSMTSFRLKRDGGVPMEEVSEALSLEDDVSMDVILTTTTVQGTQIVKMQEKYKGEDVWDAIVTLETDGEGGHVVDASGALYRHIDLDTHESFLDEGGALDLCLEHHNHQGFKDTIADSKIDHEIMIDADSTAHQAYIVMYLVQAEDKLQRPACIIDARLPGSVTYGWDAIESCSDCSATGTGGNVKIGKIHYGPFQRCLDVRREGDICYLENKYVRVINNNFTDATEESFKKVMDYMDTLSDDQLRLYADDVRELMQMNETASYNCVEMEGDEVNGAYSPLLDAFFYGTVISRMFEDWYGITHPIGKQLTFRIHYLENWANAMWTGNECVFGDGSSYSEFYPLVSLDVVGHEVGHGVTEVSSNLFYFEQWGGINEAFSDMMGEAAEAYLGDQDWVIGADIHISPPGEIVGLRYVFNPEKDNKSISNAENYTKFLDPHFGSGVFNKAFYTIVHDMQVPVRQAFGVFLHANRMYWHHMSDYTGAACDVLKAAYDLGQDGSKFRQAFEQVGIEVCELDDHVLGLQSREMKSNITLSKDVNATFTFMAPQLLAASVTVEASSSTGSVGIQISNGTWGDSEEKVHLYVSGEDWVSLDVTDLVTDDSLRLTITLSTSSPHPLSDVSVTARFWCARNFTTAEEGNFTYFDYTFKTLYDEYCSENLLPEDDEEADDKVDSPKESDVDDTNGDENDVDDNNGDEGSDVDDTNDEGNNVDDTNGDGSDVDEKIDDEGSDVDDKNGDEGSDIDDTNDEGSDVDDTNGDESDVDKNGDGSDEDDKIDDKGNDFDDINGNDEGNDVEYKHGYEEGSDVDDTTDDVEAGDVDENIDDEIVSDVEDKNGDDNETVYDENKYEDNEVEGDNTWWR